MIYLKQLFKTDGIRGIVGKDVTIDLAFRVGYALRLLGEERVAIGYDTRISSPGLAQALEEGASFNGVFCLKLGISSTPKVQYYSKKFRCVGVMITASHNPYEYNGIKIFKRGEKINVHEELAIQDFVYSFKKNYEDYLVSLKVNTNDEIVFDVGHGSAAPTVEKIFTEPNYHVINAQYSGIDINRKSGALYPQAIREYILKHHYDYGFSFDGDADRLIACDSKGNILDGDCLTYIIATFYQYDSVVLTHMSNQGIIHSLESKGIKVYLADVGDKNVSNMMRKYNVCLGAEASGHLIHSIHGTTGDGVLNAMEIIKILQKQNKKLSDYYEELEFYPSELRNYLCDVSTEEMENMKAYIQENFSNVYPYIRMSGTEECLRVYLQASASKYIEECFVWLEDFLCKQSS